jgi:hypothetical protein
MSCNLAPVVARTSLSRDELRIISRVRRHRGANSSSIRPWWWTLQRTRNVLAGLVDQALVAPVTGMTVTEHASDTISLSASGLGCTNLVTTTTITADLDLVRTSQLRWRLTAAGQQMVYTGRTVGGAVTPRHDRWGCVTGTRLRNDAAWRLRHGEQPLEPRSEETRQLDGWAHTLTARYSETGAYTMLDEPWDELGGRSPHQIAHQSDGNVSAEDVDNAIAHRLDERAEQLATARTSSDQGERVLALAQTWASRRTGLADGTPRWCCADQRSSTIRL